MSKSAALALLALTATLAVAGGTAAHNSARTLQPDDDATDPGRNTPLPCEAFSTPGLTPEGRSNRRLFHLANVCGIVGTDVEFQSRRDVNGKVHDYAFVGTMGAGFRIFDVTNPADPVRAGGFVDSGWQNDVQVRGNTVVSTFDGIVGEGSTISTCLRLKYGEVNGQGVDIFRLRYNPTRAVNPALQPFTVTNTTCIANPPGGAHNSTLHPSGKWLAISNCCSDWAIDVIDLRPIYSGGDPRHLYRLIDEFRAEATRCPAGATFSCIIMRRPNGSSARELWRPHDAHFSRDGNTMYVAAINSTWLVNVSGINQVMNGTRAGVSTVPSISIIPNISEPGGLDNPHNISISHQADVTSDGKVLVIADERGGGLSETRCNTDPRSGVLGALHFWALREIPRLPRTAGATPATPKKLGVYFNPNPGLLPEVLGPFLDLIPRLERGCTVHVFRLGGNGTASPGPILPGLDGVSRNAVRVLSTASYGAGVWWISFWGPPRNDDFVVEDPRSTWGNTLGWNVQFGADTWSAKEYKGYVYAGDMLRGFDVYSCANGRRCPRDPVVTLKKTGPATASPGERVTYTVSFRNIGPAPSQRARVVDSLPAQLAFVSASNGGVYNAATRKVTWHVGTIYPGVGRSLTLVARVKPGTAVGRLVVNRAEFTGELTHANPAAWTTAITP